MPLPEEDRGPAWLRDWGSKTGYTETDSFSGYVDGTSLAVNVDSLVAFANALQTEHEQDFRPHVREVFDGMSAEPANPPADFVELTEAMTHHREMLVLTTTALVNHDKAITAFVEAAHTISEEYRGADAMSAAKVSDVNEALATPTTTNAETSSTPVVTPEQAAAQTAPTTTDPAASTTTTTTTTGTTTTGSPEGRREIS